MCVCVFVCVCVCVRVCVVVAMEVGGGKVIGGSAAIFDTCCRMCILWCLLWSA